MHGSWLAAPPPRLRVVHQPSVTFALSLQLLLLLEIICAHAPSTCRPVQQWRRRRRSALVAAAAAPPGAGPEAGAEERPFSFEPPPAVDINGIPIGPGEIGLVDNPDDYEVTNPVLRADRGGGLHALHAAVLAPLCRRAGSSPQPGKLPGMLPLPEARALDPAGLLLCCTPAGLARLHPRLARGSFCAPCPPPLPSAPGYTPYDLIEFSDIPLKHEVVAKVQRPIRCAGK